ncbi:MAG TPA: membrane-associated protein [Methylomirabilota bacterium]|nr:membrane-associated protein [Methylomirabilota bacterium]
MAGEPIHLAIKIGYTIFLLVLVPVYWVHYGPRNFLWFSDIALLTTGVTLWVESPLLASMMMLAVLLPEIAWNLDFFGRLLTGRTMLGMSAYMFDGRTPGYLRALSLFHVPLPIGLVWLVTQLGYDRRAWLYQSLLALIVLPVSYWLTEPRENVNWVHGLGRTQTALAPWAYLTLLILAFALVLYLPPHLVFTYLPLSVMSS